MTAIELAKAAAARASLKSRPKHHEAAAAKAEKAAEATSRFEDDFNLCMEHFNVPESERMEALDIAKRDKAQAIICYASIAASLRRDGSHFGINDRIRQRIASEQKESA